MTQRLNVQVIVHEGTALLYEQLSYSIQKSASSASRARNHRSRYIYNVILFIWACHVCFSSCLVLPGHQHCQQAGCIDTGVGLLECDVMVHVGIPR